MPYADTTWYVNGGDQSTTGYYAVGVWTANTAIAVGAIRRQNTAPFVGNERLFICSAAGTTGATEPSWGLSRGAKTTDGTVTWQECTGNAGLNGDLTNTPTWAAMNAVGVPSLGVIIKSSDNASYQICTTSGQMGASEPAFSAVAGTITTDNVAVWTSLGSPGSFITGSAPHARITTAAAFNWFASGNTVYVAHTHTETQTGSNLNATFSSTPPAVGRLLCHDRNGNYPPTAANLRTGAVVSTSGNNFLNIAGNSLYVEGITFQAGLANTGTAGVNVGSSNNLTLKNCALVVASTGAASINLGSGSGTYNILINTTLSFATSGQYVLPGTGTYLLQNVSLAAGSAVPGTLFNLNSGNSIGYLTAEACDFSALTSGYLVNFANSSTGTYTFRDCKLNPAVTANPVGQAGQAPSSLVQFVRCDSGNAAYLSSRYPYEGVESTDINVVRSGGATDPNGQQQSRRIVTNANARWLRPFKTEPYVLWNTKTGSVAVTLCGIVNAGALPNNDDVWMEVEYLSSGTLGAVATTTKASVLAAGTPVAADGSSWSNAASWTPFKLVATLPNVALAGYIYVRPRIGKPSITLCFDPQVILA